MIINELYTLTIITLYHNNYNGNNIFLFHSEKSLNLLIRKKSIQYLTTMIHTNQHMKIHVKMVF